MPTPSGNWSRPHRRAVEAAHKGQVVGYQDRFSNKQRRYRGSEKATELDAVLLRIRCLVHKIRLKPTKKKIVGRRGGNSGLAHTLIPTQCHSLAHRIELNDWPAHEKAASE